MVNNVFQLASPQVLGTAREFFSCPSMPSVPFENDGGSGTAGAHWEQRLFDVRLAAAVQTHA